MNETTYKMRVTETHVYFVSGPLSQWHPSPFSADVPLLDPAASRPTLVPSGGSFHFSHAEQAMMAAKASVFRDQATLVRILETSSPKEQKALGRLVANFSSEIWSTVAFRIVCVMNFMKFRANPDLKDFLLATGSRQLVEGAWYDPVWGVALSWDDPAIENMSNWKGSNWLGEALMAVRAELETTAGDVDPWSIQRFQVIPVPASRSERPNAG